MKIQYPQQLATHLSLWIILSCIVIFVVVLATNYFLSRYLLEDYVERLANKTVDSTVQNVDTVLHSISSNTDSLAAQLSEPDITRKHIQQMIKVLVLNNRDIFGMTVALEPRTLNRDDNPFASYYFRNGNAINYTDLAETSYRYLNWRWYHNIKESNTAAWSEPYIDNGGADAHTVTYSTPILFAGGTTFAGVAKVDIKLSWLDAIIQRSKIGNSGFGFIVSKNDIIIAHPDKSLHMKHISEINMSTENWHSITGGKKSSLAAHFSTPCDYQGGRCRVAIKTLNTSGWKMVIVLPEQELIADINTLTLKISVVAAVGLLILFFVIAHITQTLTSPMGKLVAATKAIGAGNLNIELPEATSKDEIGALTDEFNAMRSSLKSHIAEIRETTAKQQKLESEIQIANDVQLSMIPGRGNVSLKQRDYQLFALLRPARSVGGDFYYYQEWEGTLHFIIGDVSDKGVAAALFMAKTITLYTRALREGLSPGETFTMMNEILIQNNDACMFVTALCGSVILKDHTITMANAGHMNPVVKNTDQTDGIDINSATALGLKPGIHYPDTPFLLGKETSLIMHTDGISEAHDKDGNLYGNEELSHFITELNTINAHEIGRSIIDIVDEFAADTEQFDDITLLIVHFE